MKISLIAAMANNRIIGCDNQIPWHLPADFAWFKQCTLGKPIVMGRKTYDSIGRPLPGRKNIVLTRDPTLLIDGVEIVSDITQVSECVTEQDELMVIGGGAIYNAYLPLADRLYLTYIKLNITGDTYFPDWGKDWHCIECHNHSADEHNAHDMTFVILEKTHQ